MFRRAMAREALWQGEMVAVDVAGCKVLLLDVDGQICAYHDRCPHQAFPLSRGRLEGDVLTCAAHLWQYDARTGKGLNPRGSTLTRLPCEVRDGDIWVDPGEEPGG